MSFLVGSTISFNCWKTFSQRYNLSNETNIFSRKFLGNLSTRASGSSVPLKTVTVLFFS
jgi:hypothetical protein